MTDFRIPDAIDMHCHFHPDDSGRGLGSAHSGVPVLEVVQEAKESGHAAVVLKSHSFASPQLAEVMSQLVPDIQVFGGICTDYMSGGLNVVAVESALNMGARIVWLPTVHSHQDVTGKNRINFQGEPISCVDSSGRLIDSVHEIFRLVQETGAVLATGHISAAEHYAVAKEFGRHGNVLVTHAGEEVAGPNLSQREIVELADLGAMIELTALGCHDIFDAKGKTPAEMAELIAAVGPDRCTLSTDYGFGADFGRPGFGFMTFLESLWTEGVSEAELTTMARTNPARLLGLAG